MDTEDQSNSMHHDTAHGLASLGYHCVATAVADLDRSSHWYQSIFGLRETLRLVIAGATVALLDGAGTRIELICGDQPSVPTVPSLFADPPAHLLPTGNKFLVFEVDDLALAGTELAAKGVQFIWQEKDLAPGFRSSAIRDVDGNFIHILERQAVGQGHA